jgi:hypothetical protein
MSPADWLGRWRAQLRPRPPGVDAFSLTLDDRGDEVGNTRTDVTLREGPPTLVVLDPAFGADLRDFAQVLRARGANVVIAFPNLREAEFRRRITPTLIEGIRGAAEKASVAVIGTPESAAFRDEDAYDTNYHVKAAATQVATRRLASQLREAGVELPARAAS